MVLDDNINGSLAACQVMVGLFGLGGGQWLVNGWSMADNGWSSDVIWTGSFLDVLGNSWDRPALGSCPVKYCTMLDHAWICLGQARSWDMPRYDALCHAVMRTWFSQCADVSTTNKLKHGMPSSEWEDWWYQVWPCVA